MVKGGWNSTCPYSESLGVSDSPDLSLLRELVVRHFLNTDGDDHERAVNSLRIL